MNVLILCGTWHTVQLALGPMPARGWLPFKHARQTRFGSRPDMRTAIHRVDSYSPHSVRIAIMIGTPMNAPGTPQRKLHRKTASKTMNGDIDSAAPAMRGSR